MLLTPHCLGMETPFYMQFRPSNTDNIDHCIVVVHELPRDVGHCWTVVLTWERGKGSLLPDSHLSSTHGVFDNAVGALT